MLILHRIVGTALVIGDHTTITILGVKAKLVRLAVESHTGANDTSCRVERLHEGGSFNLGDQITVSVLGVKGRDVRLGIAAPKDVPVHRLEIYERILADHGRVQSLDTLRNKPED